MANIEYNSILQAYKEVVAQYPNIPPMAFWRPWEMAYIGKYASFNQGLTLDLACGDGKFAEIVLKPLKLPLIGCDIDPLILAEAEKKHVYQELICADVRDLPFDSDYFANVFSNCAFEHFDDIDLAIQEVWRILKPGGKLIFTAVTDNFMKWQPLTHIGKIFGFSEQLVRFRDDWIRIQHLKNPLSAASWSQLLREKHFVLDYLAEYIPWLPTYVFLILDQQWHLNYGKRYLNKHKHDKKLPFGFDWLFKLLTITSLNPKRGSGILIIARKGE